MVLNDAKSYRGRFEGVSQETLIVRLETGEQSFDRKSVLRVSAKAGSHRPRNAMLGGLIGIAGGAGIGAAAGKSSKSGFTAINESVGAGAGAIIGLGAGVGAGAALPVTAWRTVYRARQPSTSTGLQRSHDVVFAASTYSEPTWYAEQLVSY